MSLLQLLWGLLQKLPQQPLPPWPAAASACTAPEHQSAAAFPKEFVEAATSVPSAQVTSQLQHKHTQSVGFVAFAFTATPVSQLQHGIQSLSGLLPLHSQRLQPGRCSIAHKHWLGSLAIILLTTMWLKADLPPSSREMLYRRRLAVDHGNAIRHLCCILQSWMCDTEQWIERVNVRMMPHDAVVTASRATSQSVTTKTAHLQQRKSSANTMQQILSLITLNLLQNSINHLANLPAPFETYTHQKESAFRLSV